MSACAGSVCSSCTALASSWLGRTRVADPGASARADSPRNSCTARGSRADQGVSARCTCRQPSSWMCPVNTQQARCVHPGSLEQTVCPLQQPLPAQVPNNPPAMAPLFSFPETTNCNKRTASKGANCPHPGSLEQTMCSSSGCVTQYLRSGVACDGHECGACQVSQLMVCSPARVQPGLQCGNPMRQDPLSKGTSSCNFAGWR